MLRSTLLASLGAVMLATAAGGSPRWGIPVTLSAPDRALGPELAVSPGGDAIVVWDQEVGPDCPQSPASLTCIHIVEVTTRARGSSAWQAPIELGRPGVGSRPRAALDDVGNAAVSWVHDIGRDRVLQATYRRGPSGSWPEPNDLSVPSLEVGDHQIALDAAGDAVAVWADRAETSFVIKAEVRPVALGGWGAAVVLSRPSANASGGPSLAVTPGGFAAAVWIEGGVVRAANGNASTGAWDPAVDLSSGSGSAVGSPQIAVAPGGDAAVVWASRKASNGTDVVLAAFRRAGGAWEGPIEIGSRRPAFSTPQIGLDRLGNAVAVWVGTRALEAAARSSSRGAWSHAVEVSRPNPTVRDPRLSVAANGNSVAVWAIGASGPIRAALRPGASGEWQLPVSVSEPQASGQRVALDPSGRALAVWNRSVDTRVSVQGSDLSSNGPVLGRVLIPRRGTSRIPAVFSVAPAPWAAPLVGQPLWRFGDGKSTRGKRVRHAYARRGRYRVSVTQVDAAGGRSTASAMVRISRPR